MAFEISSRIYKKFGEIQELIESDGPFEWENKDEEKSCENLIEILEGLKQMLADIEDRAK